MSSAFQLFTLLVLVFAVYADDLNDRDHDVSHYLTESPDNIDGPHSDGNETHVEDDIQHATDRTVPRPSTQKPLPITISPPITITPPKPIQNGPIVINPPKPVPTPTIRPSLPPPPPPTSAPEPPKPPKKPIVLPTTTPSQDILFPGTPAEVTPILQPICGKRRGCYQWFEDDYELFIEGYRRCDARDLRRARRYCCMPQI